MNANSKPKRKPRAASRPHEEPSSPGPIVDKEVFVLLFPLSVRLPLSPVHIPDSSHQLEKHLERIDHLAGWSKFEMDQGNFGPFAQWMYNIGLVFNVRFTGREQANLLHWKLFNEKIMQGIDSLPGDIRLPPRPSRMSDSLNTTLWTFGICPTRATKGQSGHRTLQLTTGASLYVGDWTVHNLLEKYSTENPICGPDSTLIPHQLIVIGVL